MPAGPSRRPSSAPSSSTRPTTTTAGTACRATAVGIPGMPITARTVRLVMPVAAALFLGVAIRAADDGERSRWRYSTS